MLQIYSNVFVALRSVLYVDSLCKNLSKRCLVLDETCVWVEEPTCGGLGDISLELVCAFAFHLENEQWQGEDGCCVSVRTESTCFKTQHEIDSAVAGACVCIYY